jgi:hypothetical protein
LIKAYNIKMGRGGVMGRQLFEEWVTEMSEVLTTLVTPL